MNHRRVDANHPTAAAVFQYGADLYDVPVAEVMRLMLDVEIIMNSRGTGIVRAMIDGPERVFLISAGAFVTFHLPVGAMNDLGD